MMISEIICRWVLIYSLLLGLKSLASVSAICDLSVLHGNNLYNFSLTRPTAKHPHGILNEDGFYKIAVNETVLWFQLCDQMIFNHDQPRCFGCQGCGGETHCGMKCGALVSNNVGGYDVCETIGQASTANVTVLDVMNPDKGINVRMSAIGPENNCSLTVTILCDPNGVQGPYSLDRLWTCHYAAKMSHPSGCATIISHHGRGWGWFGTLIIIILCIFGVYLLAGTIYRFFFLSIRGIEVIPNLDFWLSIPQRLQGLFESLLRKARRYTQGSRSYHPVNY
ncbi:hypothetical protein H6P81_016417 [Aristolochia fimbriata]|uniref:Autophagy-related protein 27 n=1 Tax=Aristolochia fimbriata TaxID=158543 RepID=A0AAV7EC21_ARIFI|nr:hypothetical protein H6P81_016417 [Aristolochia fimbriata]